MYKTYAYIKLYNNMNVQVGTLQTRYKLQRSQIVLQSR